MSMSYCQMSLAYTFYLLEMRIGGVTTNGSDLRSQCLFTAALDLLAIVHYCIETGDYPGSEAIGKI